MSTIIGTLYNANVYTNGVNHAGVAEEVNTPKVKPKMTDHKPLSGVGTIQLPTGLEIEPLKIKWNFVNPDVLLDAADFYNSQDIMIRANADIWQNGSRLTSQPVTMFVRGLSLGMPAIALKHQENPDIETEVSVTGYKLEYNGRVIIEVDFYAQVYSVDGVDMLADYRANLGI